MHVLRQLHNDDCFNVLPDLDDDSVDLVLCDPPYGKTACKWDSVLPLDDMWQQLKRVGKERAAYIFTASQPFTSALVMSNVRWFRHQWVWEKENITGFQCARYKPLMKTEDIVVFGKKPTTYNPQMVKRDKPHTCVFGDNTKSPSCRMTSTRLIGKTVTYTHRYPTNLISFKRDRGLHPTQKPVALMEYLIRTYSNEGDTVLDFTMGSGSTGVACMNTGRHFIGIEREPDYFGIADKRIQEAN